MYEYVLYFFNYFKLQSIVPTPHWVRVFLFLSLWSDLICVAVKFLKFVLGISARRDLEFFLKILGFEIES